MPCGTGSSQCLNNLHGHGDRADPVRKKKLDSKINEPPNDGEKQEHTRLYAAKCAPAARRSGNAIGNEQRNKKRGAGSGEAENENDGKNRDAGDQQCTFFRLGLFNAVAAQIAAGCACAIAAKSPSAFGALGNRRFVGMEIAVHKNLLHISNIFYNIIYS